MQLQPQHLTITGILEKRLFRIPEYQRAYSWEKRQRKDLFSDIKNAFEKKQDHFMATIVGLKRGAKNVNTDLFAEVEIVDGQQRITTLIILLKAIEKALDAANYEIKKDLQKLFIKNDDYSMILLQTNHDSSQIFSTYLKTGKTQSSKVVSASDKNIVDAISECEIQVNKWVDAGKLIEFLGVIKNSLSVIYHELSDEAVVYSVFEVLNSRGLDVSWLDKTKSQLLALIFENIPTGIKEDLLHDIQIIWRDIFRELGLRDNLGVEALKFAGTLALSSQPSKVLSEQNAYSSIVEMAGENQASIKAAAEWLREVVYYVSNIEKNARYSAVTKISHARLLANSILSRKFAKDIEEELMTNWEKMSFRVFGIGDDDARNKVSMLVRLAYDIRNSKMPASEIKNEMLAISNKKPINEYIDKLDYWDNCYDGWAQELRYVLFRYEEHLAERRDENITAEQWEKIWIVNPSKSIEHIEPQSSDKDYIHYLGNLTMLTPNINSSLKDKPPLEKATVYKDLGLIHTSQVGREILDKQEWTRQDVLNRTELIAEFIKTEWGDDI